MKLLTVGSLFAGIGGFDLGLERTGGFETVWQVENDSYCNKVLAKHWPNVRKHNDVKTFPPDDGTDWTVDVIVGGFPCQPFSCAGKRAGTEDDRYLWPDMLRVISALKPSWVIAENVRGLLSLQDGVVFEQVLSDLEGAGYEVQPFVIPACAVDAPHRRDRVWMVAHSEHNGRPRTKERRSIIKTTEQEPSRQINAQHIEGTSCIPRTKEDVANTSQERQQGIGTQGEQESEVHGRQEVSMCDSSNGTIWPTEPDVGRVAYGISNRMDRLKCLGNAVVPGVVEMIGRAILDAGRVD